MNKLLKNGYLSFLLLAAGLFVSGCQPMKRMTYQDFLIRFQTDCPNYYLIKDLTNQSTSEVCDCMLKTTQQNYPTMESLMIGIRKNDREPRGEADYVPSAIRMAAATCIKPE